MSGFQVVEFRLNDRLVAGRQPFGATPTASFRFFNGKSVLEKMPNKLKLELVVRGVRTQFIVTGRQRASRQIGRSLREYFRLASGFDALTGTCSVQVPAMRRIDEDMREWSFFMILDHNVRVNRSMTDITCSLADGREPMGYGAQDPKTDVIPSTAAGEEQVDAFRESVDKHLELVSRIKQLRGTRSKSHPIFGDLDAHGWHCVFALHLNLHLKQARAVARMIH